jgi:methylmalonyl-CoA mutase
VWLAGRPELGVDGVDEYVYAGCDALAAIGTVHEQLGVRA